MNSMPGDSVENKTSDTRNVLLVDDDKKFCRLLTEYLKPLGYNLSAVHTGLDGVDRALAEPWHAILLDLMLPGIDGLEVLRRIRATSDVPVLMLTARGEETDRIVGLEVGADDYLPKTFSTRELLARLRSVTRRSPPFRTAVISPRWKNPMRSPNWRSTFCARRRTSPCI